VGIIITGHPLDTVKVRLQTQGHPPKYAGMVDCLRQTIRNEGFRGLYKGMGAPLVAYTPMWALCFYGYETGKKIQGKTVQEMNYAEIALAGSIAGFFTTVVMGPAERIKTLLQAQSGGVKMYNGPIDVVRKIGLRGTFQGTMATLYRDVPASAGYFGAYEFTKNAMRRPDGSVGVGGSLLAGGMAGVMNWTVCMPMDVVKSRVQAAPAGSESANAMYVLRTLLAKEGPIALYKGFGTVLVRAFPCNAIGFVLYDFANKKLDQLFPDA